jgi:hypothetical protein
MRKQTEIPLGTRYGRLVTTAPAFMKKRSDGRNRAAIEVLCDCGNTKIVWLFNLTSGNSTSCGCYHKEIVKKGMISLIESGQHIIGTKAKTHGKSKTKLYKNWKTIIRRCESEVAHNYKWYGGKGVKMCDEWREDFEKFELWSFQNNYTEGLELDRIDSDGNYSPENCQWVTKKENLRRRDRYWSDELDNRLTQKAKELNINPYEFIKIAIEEKLSR